MAGIVIDNGDGSPIHPNRVSPYERRLRDRLWMSRVRLHDMRHYAASAALRAGVVDLTVSRMLGHSRTSNDEGPLRPRHAGGPECSERRHRSRHRVGAPLNRPCGGRSGRHGE
jgi:hypothetical protein